MANNVHHLGTFQNSVILTLEHVLEKARAGEINSLFIAGTLNNTDVIGCALLDDESDIFSLLGRLEAGKHAIACKIHGLTQDIDFSTEA